MKKLYNTQGTCARQIEVDIEDGVVRSVRFVGGCPGNLEAITRLVTGMETERVRALLRGVTCGHRPTSCADQLVCAIDEVLAELKAS